MKNKFTPTPFVDEHLEALKDTREAQTDDFFYTRLRARMESENQITNLPFRPAWVISLLTIFLFINVFVFSREIRTDKKTDQQTSSLQNFAGSYHLSVSTPY